MGWKFCIDLPPKGAARCRSSVLNGAVHVYPDRPTDNWKASVAWIAAGVLPKEILEGPVRVTVVAVLPRPKRLLERFAKTGLLKCGEEGLLWAPVKPDKDNIEKIIFDGLKAIWRDDAQVVFGTFAKVYAEASGKARVVVMIDLLDGPVPEYVRAFVDELKEPTASGGSCTADR